MARHIRKVSPILWLACSCVLWSVAFISVKAVAPQPPVQAVAAQNPAEAPKTPQAPKPQQSTDAVPDAQGFIGEKGCVECHDAQKSGYFESKHHRAVDARTPGAKQSCESCHGPVGKHAEDPVLYPIGKDFNKMKPAEVTAVCTTCHNRGEHALWEGSQHENRGLTCTTCHSSHAYQSENAQLKKETQMQVCAQCHREKVAKVDRSGHMPVREGKLQCSTCHNTHGSTNVKLLRKGDSVTELCTSCHAEKRGPFLWEHGPGRDGCVNCHDPHGSSNDRMLVTRTPMLCQRCHVATRHPSTIYDAAVINTSVRVYARSCVTCHAAIHGSNHPSGQRFIR
jgi:DmsE family decaheme c-type cytochrome